jgi:hypothetical protein
MQRHGKRERENQVSAVSASPAIANEPCPPAITIPAALAGSMIISGATTGPCVVRDQRRRRTIDPRPPR